MLLSPSYYCLTSIETESNTVPCTFAIDAAALGYLQHALTNQHGARQPPVDDDQQATTLPAGTTLQLPLWLALPLVKRGMVTVQLPLYLSHRSTVALLADPTQANLSDRCPHFYSVGLALSHAFDRPDLRQVLQRSLKSRFERILEQAQLFGDERPDNQGIIPFKNKLAVNERKIFQYTFEAQSAYRQWKDRYSLDYDKRSISAPRKKPRHCQAQQ